MWCFLSDGGGKRDLACKSCLWKEQFLFSHMDSLRRQFRGASCPSWTHRIEWELTGSYVLLFFSFMLGPFSADSRRIDCVCCHSFSRFTEENLTAGRSVGGNTKRTAKITWPNLLLSIDRKVQLAIRSTWSSFSPICIIEALPVVPGCLSMWLLANSAGPLAPHQICKASHPLSARCFNFSALQLLCFASL